MVRHFKHYLIVKQFIVRTDHQALTWLRTMKEIDRSVAHWYEEPQQYDFTVQYRKWATHSNAGALSRRPLSAERDSGVVGTLFLIEPTRHTQSTDPDTDLLYEGFLASSYKLTAEEMNSSSKAAKRIWRQWSKLILEDEVLWYQEDATSPKRLVVPNSLMQTVLQELHEQMGHAGEKKMVEVLSKRYWWPSLIPDVLDFCRTCITCSSFKKPHSTPTASLKPMPTGFSGERVGIDTMGPLPLTKRGNRYILVVIDYFTKVAEAEAMKSQDVDTVASTFFNCWICQHGVSESIHSDQGPDFESRHFIELCKTFGIAKTRTTPGHPQGTGQVERTNRTLIRLLKAFTRGAKPKD
ncbi:Transposon Ty3-I Gag-Pol polyprotein [Taenia solium]|eukprot:TsM_000100800 transcript=TsM_000100800 gene=TsM_000100800